MWFYQWNNFFKCNISKLEKFLIRDCLKLVIEQSRRLNGINTKCSLFNKVIKQLNVFTSELYRKIFLNLVFKLKCTIEPA